MDMINLKNNMLMNKKKSLYEAPTTNILVVRFEGMLMASGDPRKGGINNIGGDDVLNDDDAYNS